MSAINWIECYSLGEISRKIRELKELKNKKKYELNEHKEILTKIKIDICNKCFEIKEEFYKKMEKIEKKNEMMYLKIKLDISHMEISILIGHDFNEEMENIEQYFEHLKAKEEQNVTNTRNEEIKRLKKEINKKCNKKNKISKKISELKEEREEIKYKIKRWKETRLEEMERLEEQERERIRKKEIKMEKIIWEKEGILSEISSFNSRLRTQAIPFTRREHTFLPQNPYNFYYNPDNSFDLCAANQMTKKCKDDNCQIKSEDNL